MDASKFADLVLLVVDGSFGFEMETFEFLNMLQASLSRVFPGCSMNVA
jgi:translation initiation factor IF-2